MLKLRKLKKAAKDICVLYVEDNNKLRNNAVNILKKFFKDVYSASDGKEGLAMFKKHRPQIVITDIKMPNLDGLKMSALIKDFSPETKIIVMSAFDTNEHLHKSIEIGVFRFLLKPVNINNFSDILETAIKDIYKEKNKTIFYMHLQNVFNYQSSMVLMLKDKKPILANQMFLDFFNIDKIENFTKQHISLGNHFLEHKGFLYNTKDKNWYQQIRKNLNKLYNVKMLDKDNQIKHFIIKLQEIPEKEAYSILSFDDVTELNLLKLFDEKKTKTDKIEQDSKAMFKLLSVFQRNHAPIKVHNYYKGLGVTHDALIVNLTNDSLIIKTTYMQQKAMQYERRCIIESEALPNPIYCKNITNISFKEQTITLENLSFCSTSPITRENVRVVPEDDHNITLFLGENKFNGDAQIADLSLDAIKIRLNAMPPGLKIGDKVIIDIVFPTKTQPIIINTKVEVFRIDETKHYFDIVCKFGDDKKALLVQYITKRQMAIIREFKELQNG